MRLSLAAARAAANVLSPAGKRARLSILIFHRVREQPDPLFPEEMTAQRFEQLLGVLGRVFHLLPLAEAIAGLRNGNLPARSACVTFDDGYRDNVEIALPILRRRGVPAAFFIATGFLDGGRMWNDTLIEVVRRSRRPALDLKDLGLGTFPLGDLTQRRASVEAVVRAVKHLPHDERSRAVGAAAAMCDAPLPDGLMMTSDQVRTLAAAGMEIGGHTVSHPILARLDRGQAQREISDGRARLQELTGRPVRFFAYPNGKPRSDYLPAHVELVKELGFEAALSTMPGVSTVDSDVYQLPRFTPWDLYETRFVWRAVANLRRTASLDGLPKAPATAR